MKLLLTALLISVSLLAAFASNRSNFWMLYHSDTVQAYMIGGDLFANPSSVFDWYLPPALFAFPDWLLAGGLAALWPGSHRLLPLFYAAILIAAYCVAAGALIQRSVGMPARMSAWLFAAGAAVAAVATPLPAGTMSSQWLFTTSSAAAIHSGAIVMTLVSATILLRLLGDPSWPSALWLAAICFVTGFSDALIFVWFVAPAIVVLLLAGWANRSVKLARVAALLGVVATLTLISDVLLRGASLKLERITPLGATRLFLDDVAATIMQGDAGFLVMALAVPVMFTRGLLIVTNLLRRRAQTPAAHSELFLAGSTAAALLAPLVTGLYTEVVLMRYMLIIPMLIGIWTLQMLVMHVSTRVRAGLAFFSVALTVLIGAASVPPAWSHVQQLQRPGLLEACLTERQLDTGIGDYWSAKGLMFESGKRIHIIQVTPAGDPFRWIFKQRWFQRHAGTGLPLQPNFIIMTRLDRASIEKRFSRPAEVVQCEGQEVWMYKDVIDFQTE